MAPTEKDRGDNDVSKNLFKSNRFSAIKDYLILRAEE